MFPAFFDRPNKVRFADQEDGEQVELFLRQHPITTLPWVLVSIVLAILPLTIGPLLRQITFLRLYQIPDTLTFSIVLLWYMLVVAYILEHFLRWYFNIYIVTNLHVVDVNFHNILYRDKVEIRLEDIQSSKPSIKGVIGSLFHFGDIIIETAAERQRIEFRAVPKPDMVAERIQDLQRVQEGNHAG